MGPVSYNIPESRNRANEHARRTTRVSDRRRPRTQAVSADVHKSDRVKTETLSGGSLDSLVLRSPVSAIPNRSKLCIFKCKNPARDFPNHTDFLRVRGNVPSRQTLPEILPSGPGEHSALECIATFTQNDPIDRRWQPGHTATVNSHCSWTIADRVPILFRNTIPEMP